MTASRTTRVIISAALNALLDDLQNADPATTGTEEIASLARAITALVEYAYPDLKTAHPRDARPHPEQQEGDA